METTTQDLFTPTGHLTELTADRILCGELDGDPEVTAHLSACPACQSYLERLRAEDDAFATLGFGTFAALEARRQHAPVSPTAASNTTPRTSAKTPRAASLDANLWTRARRPLAALTAATAALLLFAVWAPKPTRTTKTQGTRGVGTIGVKSAGLGFEVHVHDGHLARLAMEEEEVHPGDRIGFRFHPAPTGHVMIIGIDETQTPYLGYPQDTGGRARAFPAQGAAQSVALEQALVLDSILGRERLIALSCPRPFTFDEVTRVLKTTPDAHPLLPGCAQRDQTLRKTARRP